MIVHFLSQIGDVLSLDVSIVSMAPIVVGMNLLSLVVYAPEEAEEDEEWESELEAGLELEVHADGLEEEEQQQPSLEGSIVGLLV